VKKILVAFFGVVLSAMFYAAEAAEPPPPGTTLQLIERLTRLQEGQKALNQRIDSLEKRIDGRIDGLDKRIDDLRQHMDSRIDDLRQDMLARFNLLTWMLGIYITISVATFGAIGRVLWLQERRLSQVEASLAGIREEVGFLRSLVEKLLPPKGSL